ncbi:GDSL-type esterase/lipase family protein [Methylobacterium nodulans]|uniref:Lipolytic protein G-D-S-L family n=1 Tax=Methylobacterium nodulans (strain LMG 21967 / CNCM I-2342 / ORS 2060) TaxID=460265 RepID=B8IPQ5_METNO|nr:GDSL-type esterase/lipase family protein [Methylobacterium nodulans]ACL56555.1 lipolytic protein G-D-S-L family [Methylobacterium nodulans ORS 2060]
MTDPRGLAPPAKPSGLKRHARLAARVPLAAELVLLGDSLAAGWPAAQLPAGSFNFGLPGDRIQTTRWRLRAVDLRALCPRAAILWVGTNNFGDGDPVAEILAGLDALAGELRGLWRGAGIVLITLPWRAPVAARPAGDRPALNRGIAALARARGAALLDAEAALGGEAQAARHLAADRLHVTAEGYARLGAALARLLAAGSPEG